MSDKVTPAGSPRISVLVSTYNAEKYMRACLADLEAQTIADQLEIIVIDSGSQQNERAIVEDFQTRYSNIVYLRTERERLYEAWNRAIPLTKGKYITNANSDDAHRPDALEVLAAALDANPEADLAYGDYFNASEPNDNYANPHISRRVAHPPYHPATLMFYCITGCHPMWRRELFFKVGVFDTQYLAPGDYDFVLRAVQAGLRAVRVPQFLSMFYQNPKGLSYQSEERSKHEWELIQAKYWRDMPIERLFAVNTNHAESVALGWTALGNLAMNIKHPWFDNYSQHLEVAVLCYERALARSPKHPAALHNLALARILKEEPGRAEAILPLLAAAQRDALIRQARSGTLKLIPVHLKSAVEALDYYPTGQEPAKPSTPKTMAAGAPLSRAAVRWVAPYLSPGGYSRDSIDSALGLAPHVENFGTRENSNFYSERHAFELPKETKESLLATRAKFNFLIKGITISTSEPGAFQMPPDSLYTIARTTVEADALPSRWVTACNQMREIWVPSQFTLEACARGGVERSKLRVIPAGVDAEAFSREKAVAATLPNRAEWNFLFCDGWQERSGWDILLTAYFGEFSERDDVCLYIASQLPGKTMTESADEIRLKTREVATALGSTARFEVLAIAESELPGVLQACDGVVLPARAEGWGRNQLQALLMEKPVITTGWGAHMDFCEKEHCDLIDFELAEIRSAETDFLPLRGQKWAAPSLEHMRTLLRETLANPEAARAKARGQRARLERFDRTQVGREMAQRLNEIDEELRSFRCGTAKPRIAAIEPSVADKPLKVSWEGSFLDFGSLSQVNRGLTTALAADKNLQISRVCQQARAPKELERWARKIQAEAPKQVDVTVRHAWPPNWERPATGAWVLIQPWEFGVLPADWVKELGSVDEIWAPSEYVRSVYVDSGIHPAKVKIVPNGIDAAVFRPEAAPLELATKKSFKFLFVGGTIQRKGPDVLLKAYLETFTAADDVCLVIKDFGGQSVYQGQTLEKEVAAIRQNPDAPEILYLTEELAPEAMPQLYTACQCLVHPYRGEGFGLPALEAMACGLPVVVTAGGSTDDFATDAHAYRLPALRTPISNTVGGLKLKRNGWWLEPERKALSERMRWILGHREEARELGVAASTYARRDWTWERAARIAGQRLQDLAARKKAEAKTTAERRARKGAAIELPNAAKVGELSVARALLAKKEFLPAWRASVAASEVRPYHPEAYLLLAEIATAAGNSAVAERCARKAKAMAPEWNAPKQFLKSHKGATAGASERDGELAAAMKAFDRDTPRAPRLTVCMIVKNEEKFLGQCLQSIREVASQIIVVDTGSTDQTIAIAKKHGADVHHFAWRNDFSAARNAALEQATGDWILSIDADEELLPEHKETLRREMQSAETMAYRLPMIDKGREEEGGSYVPRLFRNAPGVFFLGRVHEQAFSAVEARCRQWGLKHQVGKCTLLHHGYTDALVSDRNKVERNLRLLELAIEELPNEPNLLMNYGLELVRSGHLSEGLEQYQEALRCAAAQPASEVTPELREALLTQLTSHLTKAKCFEQIVRVWQMPFARSGAVTASQHFHLGLAYMELKQPGPAAEQMRQCLAKRNAATFGPRNPEILKAGPAHCLALCLASLQQTAAAAESFRAAIAIDPKARPPRFDYARFLAETGKPIEALQQLNELATEKAGDLNVWRLGGQIALSKPEFRQFACDWTHEALKHFADAPTIILQRAEALFLAEHAGRALPFWRDARLPKSARSDAARVLCEIITGDRQFEIPPGEEAAISQEALKWYRRLIAVGANLTVDQLHRKIDVLRGTLPGFVSVWETATRKAAAAMAV